MNLSSNHGTGPDIRIDQLSKEYQFGENQVRALDEVSVTVKGGQFCVFHGPSGSGKSTLLHLIGALDHPTSGSITVGDQRIDDQSEDVRTSFRRTEVGYVFQALNLIENLTALENVLVPFIPQGSDREMEDKARDILADVGLGDRLHHRPGRLSGGEQQRVAIARAVLKEPSLVLADEPTGELDTETGTKIFSLLRNINEDQNATVIVVTHDTEYIRDEDTTFRMRDGRCREDQQAPSQKPE